VRDGLGTARQVEGFLRLARLRTGDRVLALDLLVRLDDFEDLLLDLVHHALHERRVAILEVLGLLLAELLDLVLDRTGQLRRQLV
jgi:hypothetical protein